MKTVIVTGSSRGIGAEIACQFASAGYNTVINYNHSENEAKELGATLSKKGYSVFLFQADLTKESDAKKLIKETIEKFGTVDVLVNNAGISQIKLLIDTNESDFYNIIDNNLKSVINMCRFVAPIMTSQQSGKIVNIASIWGEVGASCESLYSASKAAVIGFSKALAKELGPSFVNVNVVSPGFIQTEMNKELTSEIFCQIKESTPLCKLGTVEDVANAVMFLTSEKASFITGQVLSVNGGWEV